MRRRGERYNKKGLSPLVATILLIAFAVSLGTMIMSWSIDAGEKEETPQEVQENLCKETTIELQSLTDGPAICYNAQSQHVKFLLKNTGDTTIEKFTLRVIDQNQDLSEQQVRADLPVGGLGSFEIAYNTVSPNNLAATITPTVAGQACPKQELETTRIQLC